MFEKKDILLSWRIIKVERRCKTLAPLKNALKFFGLVVNGLVSDNCFETIEEIEKHFEEENIVEYICERYKDTVDLSPFREDGPYSIDKVNKYFANYTGYIKGNERRKFCVGNNGLCLIVALCLEGVFDN